MRCNFLPLILGTLSYSILILKFHVTVTCIHWMTHYYFAFHSLSMIFLLLWDTFFLFFLPINPLVPIKILMHLSAAVANRCHLFWISEIFLSIKLFLPKFVYFSVCLAEQNLSSLKSESSSLIYKSPIAKRIFVALDGRSLQKLFLQQKGSDIS